MWRYPLREGEKGSAFAGPFLFGRFGSHDRGSCDRSHGLLPSTTGQQFRQSDRWYGPGWGGRAGYITDQRGQDFTYGAGVAVPIPAAHRFYVYASWAHEPLFPNGDTLRNESFDVWSFGISRNAF